ncbi:hypothetical protein SDC9_07916 [bioreactor metagenome]|uniref:Thioredoxin domain-containing protein n=1 Tax=bioreactor metagenome TaxID=1076179 RepID=A0A644T5W8_9ZZZZ|nr:hypothetical protein [Candidatus Elulimicrobiales bacterium]
MKKKNVVVLILILLLVLFLSIYWLFKAAYKFQANSNTATTTGELTQLSDAQKFQAEYPGVAIDNRFVYRSAEEIINILKGGTGLVYLGFPECPWCQRYTVYLDEVAREQNLEKIYYYNVRQIRTDNTPEYQEMVALLGENLDKDTEGNPRIFVPDLTAVKNGEIIAHDNSTSLLNSAVDGTPDEWWTEERVNSFKENLKKIIEPVNICYEVCNS